MNLQVKVNLAGGLIRALGATWRLDWKNLGNLEMARQGSPSGNVIHAIYHGNLAILAWTHRQRPVRVLVSHHQDGELIARILARLGFGLVRGSSRRGGVAALFRLSHELENGHDIAITVDGPLGPCYDVHPGVLLLARRTGRPIVPVIATASRRLVLPSWDAMSLPLPGSLIRLHHGPPVWVPADCSGDDMEVARQRLQNTMREITRDEESRHGRVAIMRDIQDHRGHWERWSAMPKPAPLLRGLAGLYRVGVRVDRLLRPRPRGYGERPWVVGIGNLEAGGTGKTPVLLLLAHYLCERGCRVGVLTRGHSGTLGRESPLRVDPQEIPAGASDETRLLRETLPENALLVVSRNKKAGLATLRRDKNLDLILVDDAFQSASVAIDRHLLLLDWQNPFGNGHLLPAGRLRERSVALQRADAILFTRAHGRSIPSHTLWSKRTDRCFLATESIGALRRFDGTTVDAQSLRGQGIATICGIGKPEAFEALVGRYATLHGFSIRRSVRVADHGDLRARLDKLLERSEALGCSEILMTRKDACRLAERKKNEPLLIVEQRLELEAMDQLVKTLVPDTYSSAKSAISTVDDA